MWILTAGIPERCERNFSNKKLSWTFSYPRYSFQVLLGSISTPAATNKGLSKMGGIFQFFMLGILRSHVHEIDAGDVII